MVTRPCLALALAALAPAACTEVPLDPALPEEPLPYEPVRPERPTPEPLPAYTGADPVVLEAQARFPTGLDLHAKVIRRTCSPTDGVCHNTKEYPDLHTAANLLATIDAPCNIQPGTREGVFDRCERPGDRFELVSDAVSTGPIEIGHITYIPGPKPELSQASPPTAETPGLHIALADPIVTDRVELWSGGRFIRTFVEGGLVQDIAYQTLSTRWWILDGGRRVMGEVNDWQADEVKRLLQVGVVEGDANMNGLFGAREGDPIAMIEPGSPETSYLVARVRGVMEGETVPGTRMPLANQPLSNSEMLALFCFIEGLGDRPAERLDAAIDYVGCSYSADPTNLDLYGETATTTWSGRISKLLEVNCGGCHDATTPSADLALVGDQAYDALLGPSEGRPDLALIEPGDPDRSYLWLKLTNGPDIDGGPMPTSPLTGWRPLPSVELEAIRTWIEDGALRD